MNNELDQSDHYQPTTRPRSTDPHYESLRDHNAMRRKRMTHEQRTEQRWEQARVVALFLALLAIHILTWIIALAILD